MKNYKRYGLRLFFVAEVCVFLYVYTSGSRGVKQLASMRAENEALQQSIASLENDVAALQKKKGLWESNDFYKEKIAREQLQMARKDDTIYYLS